MNKKDNYKDTLNLPQTKFPLWVNHDELQRRYLNFWAKEKIYQKIRKIKRGKKKYILHDGPPYANGNLHVGHVLNKVLKDAVVKYKTMQGYDAPFIPGWDCHGLPIEHAVIDKAGLNKDKMSDLEIRKKCKDYALKFVAIQKEQFRNLGIIGDWENPYLTINPLYEAQEYEVLLSFVQKGYIFQEKKPVAWCTSCQTALAEAEIEYKDHFSPSIFVKFYFKYEPKILADYKEKKALVAWTTTPWTLPANQALALHPRLTYLALKVENEILIVAEKLLKDIIQELGIKSYKILKKFTGQKILGEKVHHPLPESLISDEVGESVIILADFVDSEQGTGVVHIAPGHGHEDYQVGKKFNLAVKAPVDKRGNFTEEAGIFAGLNVFEANKKIIENLKEKKLLLKEKEIIHSYPCCWRCKKPIIFRATRQWFINTDKIRKKALNYVKKVQWIPPECQERMTAMLLEKPDWCISRQRKWGVPIPSVICQKCGEEILDARVIKKVKKFVLKEGSNTWFARKINDFLPSNFSCPFCGGKNFNKGKDILDVWFDSGVSYLSLLEIHPNLSYPSDLYLEGSDQHRGWFQSSLLANIGYCNKAPYKAVLTHGFIVDDKGNKMSKSLGNIVDPLFVQENFGNEILRLWALSVDYHRDVSISSPKIKKGSAPILEQVSEMYFKLRNTLRFLLGNLYDFNYQKDRLSYQKLLEIDQWILAELQQLIEKVNLYFEKFEFYKAISEIYYFSTIILSAIYFDILKDRLYTGGRNSLERKSAQNVLFILLKSLVTLLTPIISFTAEEAWDSLSSKNKGSQEKSVLLLKWPRVEKRYSNKSLLEKYKRLLKWRDEVNKRLDGARRRKLINSSLEAQVQILIKTEKEYKFLKQNKEILPTFFIVSDVVISKEEVNRILIKKAPGEKCIRCWKYSSTVGRDKVHNKICDSCLKIIKNQK